MRKKTNNLTVFFALSALKKADHRALMKFTHEEKESERGRQRQAETEKGRKNKR